ncbi:hypothetical protein ABIB06_001461 [Bradyrhizobium sp. LB8.2]
MNGGNCWTRIFWAGQRQHPDLPLNLLGSGLKNHALNDVAAHSCRIHADVCGWDGRFPAPSSAGDVDACAGIRSSGVRQWHRHQRAVCAESGRGVRLTAGHQRRRVSAATILVQSGERRSSSASRSRHSDRCLSQSASIGPEAIRPSSSVVVLFALRAGLALSRSSDRPPRGEINSQAKEWASGISASGRPAQ